MVKPRLPPFVVALVGGDEAVVVDPLHGIRLARDAGLRAGERDDAVLLGVDASARSTRTGGEVARVTLPVARSTMAMWLFSCSVTTAWFAAVDVDEFRFRIFRRDRGEAGEVDDHASWRTRRRRPASGKMVRLPPGSCGMAPSFTSSSRSFSMTMARYLPSALFATESGWPPRSQVAATALLATIDDGEMAGRLGLRFRGDDADQRVAPDDDDRGGLAVERRGAGGLRRLADR